MFSFTKPPIKIVLMGYMGSGKSTIGKSVANRLKLPFLDLDEQIEFAENLPIREIFRQKGEIYFRKNEAMVLEEILNRKDNFVLSLGGGTPCYGNNMAGILKCTDNSFYLKKSVQDLAKRLIFEKDKRPIISHLNEDEMLEFVGKHLFERSPFYQQANYTVQVLDKSVKAITEEIIELLG